MEEKWKKLILILALLLPIFFAGFISSLVKREKLVRELGELKNREVELSEENERLDWFLQYSSLKANLERLARERLNLAKPGEVMVIFVSPSPSPIVGKKGWFDFIKNFFQKFEKQ